MNRLPIKLDATSNGEFAPIPVEPVHDHANRLAAERITENARRTSVSRRRFLAGTCGAATTLLAMNAAYAAAGRTGGYFALAPEAGLDTDAALDALGKREFIFDVQGHFVNPEGAWLSRLPATAKPLSGMPAAGCALANEPGDRSYLQCIGPDSFVKDVFMDSDTYEQVHLQRNALEDALPYMIPNLSLEVDFYQGEPVAIELPKTVDLQVTETEPGMKGATASASGKPATLETGLVVSVPQFVDIGDTVRVDTSTGEYLTRV